LSIDKRGFPFLLLAALALPAFSEEQCSDFITKATAKIVQATQTSNPNDLGAGFYHACAMTFQEYGQAYGASANVAFLRFGGKGEFSERSFGEFKKNRCKQVTGNDARSAARYYFQQGSDTGAIEAWRKCMQQREGLTCWVEPEGGNATVNINWKGGSEPKVGDSRLSTGNTAERAPSESLLPKGESLARGLKRVQITRQSGTELVASLSLESQGADCSLYVPAALPQLPFDVAESR
jgi:hypothetical protein